jgi:hypothetical protein
MKFKTKEEAEAWKLIQPYPSRHKIVRARVMDLVTFKDKYCFCVVFR